MNGRQSRLPVILGGILAAFALAFGVAYLAGSQEGEASAPATITTGLPEGFSGTTVSTATVTVPGARSVPALPDLRTTPPAASGSGSGSGGSAPSGGPGGSAPSRSQPQRPPPVPDPPGETIIVQ